MDFNVLQMCFNIVPSIVLLVVTYFFNRTTKQHEQEIIEEQTKRKALSDGVEALLRQKIIDSYNKHQDKGFCPIYAKEGIKRLYLAYHNLGGNDVATELYHKLLAMPEEPEGSNT